MERKRTSFTQPGNVALKSSVWTLLTSSTLPEKSNKRLEKDTISYQLLTSTIRLCMHTTNNNTWNAFSGQDLSHKKIQYI